MGRLCKYVWHVDLPAACLLALVILWACSGGSSGGGVQPEGAFGRVGVLITDAPFHEYDHIWVTITEISLLPADDDCDPSCEEVAVPSGVVLPDGPLALTGCGAPAEPGILDAGMRVLAAGVFDTSIPLF